MPNIHFTSDSHSGHKNIIKYDNEALEKKLGYAPRPFETPEEMDEALVSAWNSVVAPDDTVYHLGDASMHKDIEKARAWAQRLNGRKFLILGNHDKTDRSLVRNGTVNLLSFALGRDYQLETTFGSKKSTSHAPAGLDPTPFELLPAEYELSVPDPDANGGRQIIILSHYAHRTWNGSHHGAWHLYGHSHGSLADDPNALSFDVGCMLYGLKPLSYREVKAKMKKKSFAPVDHHK